MTYRVNRKASRPHQPLNWKHVIITSIITAAIAAVGSAVVGLIDKGVGLLPSKQTERIAYIFNPSNLVLADERYRILETNTSNKGDMFQEASVRELEAEQRATPKHFLLDNIDRNGSALSFHLSSATNLYGEGSFRGDDTFYSGVYIGDLKAWGHTTLGECHYMTFWAVVGPPNAERLFPENSPTLHYDRWQASTDKRQR